MTTRGIRDRVSNEAFQFSNDSNDFLPELKGTSMQIIPFLLGNKDTIRGVSFFAALKALDIGENAPWYVDHLRLPGTLNKSDMNPDTQKVVLAIVHGLHAYFASMDKENAPSLLTPLPTRFRYALDKFKRMTEGDKAKVESVFTLMKRQYLNHEEDKYSNELSVRDLMNSLDNPQEFINNPYFTKPTGQTPIPIQADSDDTETVKDIYVAKIPLATVVLGRRR